MPSCRREYVCRLCSCPKPAAFFVAPLNLVDLLAILPFYLSLALGKGQVRPPCALLQPVLSARAAPRRAARSRRAGASRARQIDPFGCRDDLDMDGNAFDPSAVEEGEDSGIPNLGFLRVVRHAATKP